MPNTIVPPQIGYTPHDSNQTSKIVFGRDLNLDWEAVGLGKKGRPDELESIVINLTSYATSNPAKVALIYLNVADIVSLINLNPTTVPAYIEMRIREVSCCEMNDTTGEAEEKKMMIIASQTYSAPPTT